MVIAKAKALGLDTLAQNVSIGYVIVFLIVLGLVLWRNKTTKAKLIGGIVTVGVFALLPYWLFIHKSPAQLKAIAERADFLARYEPAKALFEKLCKEQAGEKIYRTVADVEGILLLKMREEEKLEDVNRNRKDPMWPKAALPDERGGDAYIRSFLFDVQDKGVIATINGITYAGAMPSSLGAGRTNGYRFVDVQDKATGKHTRYSATIRPRATSPSKQEAFISGIATSLDSPRYAVTFEDDVNPEYRKHWVAGTTLKIVDLSDKSVLATKTYFSFETGLGNTNQRSPWGLAFSCEGLLKAPQLYIGNLDTQTRHFTDKVLKPIQNIVRGEK